MQANGEPKGLRGSLMPILEAVRVLGVTRYQAMTEFRYKGLTLVRLGKRLYVYKDEFYKTYAEHLTRAGVPIPDEYKPKH